MICGSSGFPELSGKKVLSPAGFHNVPLRTLGQKFEGRNEILAATSAAQERMTGKERMDRRHKSCVMMMMMMKGEETTTEKGSYAAAPCSRAVLQQERAG
jgi:hypothetical protein